MMDDDVRIVLGAVAAAMSVAAHVPYLLGIWRGVNKPHLFTWIIWTLLAAIAAAAQWSAGGGAGMWTTAVTALLSLVITCAAVPCADKIITRADWGMFVCGLAALPLWFYTNDPFWAVVLVTFIDVLAVGPTLRKSWHKPHEENATMYAVNTPRHALAILALQSFTPTTWLYPAALLLMNVFMFVVLMARRKYISRQRA